MRLRWKHRYFVLLVMFVTYLLCYVDRMAMASAIPFIADEFGLSPLAMGGVMSAFFLSYSICQIPGGLLADRFGSRPVLTFGIVWWSIFTAITGFASSLSSMVVIRVLFGIGEGIFPPAAFKTIATWFPRKEVGRANGFMLTTNALGPALAPLIVTSLVVAWGWRSVFFGLFIPGIIVAALIWFFVKSSPSESNHMPQEELADYEEDTANNVVTAKIGIAELLKMPLVWFCFLALFFGNIASWGIMSWLPTYLLKSRGFSIKQMGLGASLPFFMGVIGFYLSGYLSDKYFKNSRQILVVVGNVVGALFVYLTVLTSSGQLAVGYQMVAMFFITIGVGAIFTLPVAVLPSTVVGSAMGVVNTAGQLAGFLSPLLVGYILTVTKGDYSIVFYLFVACLLISAVFAQRIKQRRVKSYGQPV